jgi:hypothetical protein
MVLLILLVCLVALVFIVSAASTHELSKPEMTFEQRLRSDSRVSRLLRNRSWAPAAKAAIEFLLRGKECPIVTWRKSATWAQIEMVHRELAAQHIK